jgi:hypothetical protein
VLLAAGAQFVVAAPVAVLKTGATGMVLRLETL